MKKLLPVVLIIMAGIGVWYFVFKKEENENEGPKQQPVRVSQHSENFNSSFQQMLDDYYSLTAAFINWDTSTINQSAIKLKTSIDSLQIKDMQKDTLVYETANSYLMNAGTNLDNMLIKNTIAEKKVVLNNLSDNLYNLFRTVRYDQEKVYWQECPMAFNDDLPGYWLSKTDEVQNPYMGTKHPKYGKTMLVCGGPKDTLNFVADGAIK